MRRLSLMRTALARNGKQVESQAVVRHDEELYNGSSRRKVYERILQFLAANLSARPAAPPAETR